MRKWYIEQMFYFLSSFFPLMQNIQFEFSWNWNILNIVLIKFVEIWRDMKLLQLQDQRIMWLTV